MEYDTVVLDGEYSLTIEQDGEYGAITEVEVGDYYTGDTDVTPGPETQVLLTEGKIVPANITINPIPSNYGLITWNGLGIRVS